MCRFSFFGSECETLVTTTLWRLQISIDSRLAGQTLVVSRVNGAVLSPSNEKPAFG